MTQTAAYTAQWSLFRGDSMPCTHSADFRARLQGLAGDAPQHAPQVVDAILQAAQHAVASDVHLVPDVQGLEMLWRIDGVIEPVDRFPRSIAANIVARLKVLADLLTYRSEVPQEGRIRSTPTAAGAADAAPAQKVEMRVSTFPTLFGEKVVVRLFVGSGRYRRLADLGWPADVATRFAEHLVERGGLLLVTGPAGSGKTTTVYAGLRELVSGDNRGRSLVSIEDPIEAVIDGVAQSQVQPAAGFTYDTGLRSLLRQDPDVVLVGEIRDRTTAELVFLASLSGHLVLSTYHAGSATAALQRLTDMGIESYQLRSGLLAVVSQRLVRELCRCARTSDDPADRLGLAVETVRLPVGCTACRGGGYRGRRMLAELLDRDEIADGGAASPGARSNASPRLADRGLEAVRSGLTSPAEYRRVFGLRTE